MSEGIKIDDLNGEWSRIVSQYVTQKIILEEKVKGLELQLENLRKKLEIIRGNLITDFDLKD